MVAKPPSPPVPAVTLPSTPQFTANDPQLFVTIDRQKRPKAIGVPLSQITAAMSTFMGSAYINDFDFNNRSYRVYVQADQAVPPQRSRI